MSSREALRIAKQIVEIENKMSPLKQKLTELQKEFNEVTGLGSGKTTVNVKSSIIDLFKKEPGKEFTVVEIKKLSGVQTSDATMRATISRLCNIDKMIERVGQGRYKLISKSE